MIFYFSILYSISLALIHTTSILLKPLWTPDLPMVLVHFADCIQEYKIYHAAQYLGRCNKCKKVTCPRAFHSEQWIHDQS